ncbi:MAG: hypothetical protein Kow0025_13540 [Thermodesulfovibrionales bacterium]
MSGSRVKIISGFPPEFSTDIKVGDVTFHVQTEDMGLRAAKLASRVYREGEVVFARQEPYPKAESEAGLEGLVKERMKELHQAVIRDFLDEEKNRFLRQAEKLLRRGGGLSALSVLKEALERFPDDPLLLSHYGRVLATVGKKPDEGIKICSDALGPPGRRQGRPGAFYLNLGKALLGGGRKSEAMQVFREGFALERENRDLLWEIKKLGVRRRPIVPFLRRRNPVNKYLGLFLSRLRRR